VIEQRDDHPHSVPPQAFMTWKENWVLCGLDPSAQAAFVFHVSLRPVEGEGIFSAKLSIAGERYRHVGRRPIPPDPRALDILGDERMRFEVLEPARRFRVEYRSPELDADLTLTGRFEPFDFADGPKPPGRSTLGEIGLSVFPFNHYEQGLAFEGELRPKQGAHAGRALRVSGWGNRDHSWGYRDDFQFIHHHWVCASFEDRYIQGSAMLERSYPDLKHGGFVSSATGNDAVSLVDTSEAYWLEPDVPLPQLDRDVAYRLETVSGQAFTVVAHVGSDHARLYLNAKSPDRSKLYQDRQIFCDYTLAETGERGAGLLEIGKYLEGEGVADRHGRAAA
jgi:hypothetical protein